MYIAEATELIRIDKISGARAQTWCDLGCGTGTFTLALATLLPPGSVIYAIDEDENRCHGFPTGIMKRHPQEGCEFGRERSLFICTRWRPHGQFLAFHRTPRRFRGKATAAVRAIADCRIRWQAAKSMGAIPARLLRLARLALETRI